MSKPPRKVRIHLSVPRAGTHFLWSRLVASGDYQLIYDADRVAALAVLSESYDRPLAFLFPPPLNPNYNFQYNSLAEASGPLPAAGHLELLARKYRCRADPEELFHRIMARQASSDRTLFSINRFVYTMRYSHPFPDFTYSIDMAMRALTLCEQWLSRGPYEHRTTIVVREIGDWVKSQIQMQGRGGLRFVRERLEDFPKLMDTCARLNIPVYEMSGVIRAVSGGALEFADVVARLGPDDVKRMCTEAAARLTDLASERVSASMFRPGRFVEYVRERDPLKRLSLVRSIGWMPIAAAPLLPVLGGMIRSDYEGVLLNNGSVDVSS